MNKKKTAVANDPFVAKVKKITDLNIQIEKEKELVFEDLSIGDRFLFKGVATACIKSGDNEYRAENIYKISESDIKLPVKRI